MIQVSPVGGRFAWADSGSGPGMAISEAALDGSQATLLDRVPGLIVSLTSDGLVLYDTFDTVMTLRDTKTGAETSWSEAVIGAIAPVVGGRS